MHVCSLVFPASAPIFNISVPDHLPFLDMPPTPLAKCLILVSVNMHLRPAEDSFSRPLPRLSSVSLFAKFY